MLSFLRCWKRLKRIADAPLGDNAGGVVAEFLAQAFHVRVERAGE